MSSIHYLKKKREANLKYDLVFKWVWSCVVMFINTQLHLVFIFKPLSPNIRFRFSCHWKHYWATHWNVASGRVPIHERGSPHYNCGSRLPRSQITFVTFMIVLVGTVHTTNFIKIEQSQKCIFKI